MDIRKSLLEDYSKKQALQIAAWIGLDAGRFAELIELTLAHEDQLSQRAAWVVSHCLDQYPELIDPHLDVLVSNLRDKTHHEAIQRNILRALQAVELPEHLWGEVADISFQYLADPQAPAAVRVFSMTVAWNICQKVPELMEELKLVIEDQWDFASAGFRSRGRKVLKQIGRSRKS